MGPIDNRGDKVTKRKENPMSRSECARLAGLASAKSPNHFTPFKDPDFVEEAGRKGGTTTGRRHPEKVKEWAMKGGLAKKPRKMVSWRNMRG